MMPTTTPIATDQYTARHQEREAYINLEALAAYNERRKDEILTELYKTGMLGGKYFGQRKVKNPIRWYITCCLYKQRMQPTEDIIDDCYNEMFLNLCKMDAAKVVAIYTEAPAKVIATALKIISLKCFAVDPRYNNPRHSLIQSIKHASIMGGAHTVSPCDVQDIVMQEQYFNNNFCHNEEHTKNHVLVSDYDQPDDFAKQYGVTVEQILEAMDENDRDVFNDMAGTQPRGKCGVDKRERRDVVMNKLRNAGISDQGRRTYSNHYGTVERKFKGSIFERDVE